MLIKDVREQRERNFINRIKNKFGDKFDYSEVHYVDRITPVKLTCLTCGPFLITPNQLKDSVYGCQNCYKESRKRKFIAEATIKFDGFYNYDLVNFVNHSTPIEVVCPEHGVFKITPNMHLSAGVGCVKCSLEKRYNTEYFVNKARNKHGDKYDYQLTKYVNHSKDVEIICPTHGVFVQRAGSHLQGNGCGKCHIEHTRISMDDFIRQAREIHGDAYDYSKVNLTSSKDPIEIICRRHGSFWQRPNNHISAKAGCKRCIESSGERRVAAILDRLNIRYIREFKIDGSNYRYDFKLIDCNILIEFNGIQHYKSVGRFGGEIGFQSCIDRDREKHRLAITHGFTMVTFDFSQLVSKFFENIVITNLKLRFRFWFKIGDEYIITNDLSFLIRRLDLPRDIVVGDITDFVLKNRPDVICLLEKVSLV